ncbi:probable glutamate receptor isoform X1 [Athalia rosae]|uniref:probable glutamate receptor isoform X1 n=2 Tax=Athalia rosae TaxID=37344 RepID=UPI0020337FC3|nr:probable glutamate receptor isoform X1 [Athalia rosae]
MYRFSRVRIRLLILIVNCILGNKKDFLSLPLANALNGVIWDKNSNDFVKIFSIESYKIMQIERLQISWELEKHNFGGKIFKFSSFPIRNLLNFENNFTEISGVHGDMWNILAGMLNFKLKVEKIREDEYGTRSKNGSWSGLLGYIWRNETDIIPRSVAYPSRLTALQFTMAIWRTHYRFYMRKKLQFHRDWMVGLFSREVWLSVFIFLSAISLLSFTQHLLTCINNEKNEDVDDPIVPTLRDHTFYIFSIFCGQGWVPSLLIKHSKILLITTRLLSWLLLIAFSSKLIAHVTQRQYHKPFTDLESLYKDTDYKIVVKRNSFVYSVFVLAPRPIYKMFVDSGRLVQASTNEAYDKLCGGRYVYFEAQDVVEADNIRTKQCDINSIGSPYYKTWISSGVVRGFDYVKTINRAILKLNECGLIDHLKSTWLEKAVEVTNTGDFESIKLGQLSLIFGMLCVSIILSLIILIMENIVHNETRCKPNCY